MRVFLCLNSSQNELKRKMDSLIKLIKATIKRYKNQRTAKAPWKKHHYANCIQDIYLLS